MKKLLPLFAATLLLASCVSLPSDSPSPKTKDETTKVEKNNEAQIDEGEIQKGNGACPQILQMGFSQSFASMEPISKLKKSSKNDSVFLYFEIKDVNWDIKSIHVSAKAPNHDKESFDIDMDYQYQEQFFFIYPLSVGDTGTWTFTARAEDHAGNLSALRRCTIEISAEN